ncbi:hypothetical protein I545_5868 [Mycobacterium kansasii 662]|uniref:Uncharacterized protein n=1 Tax=Mycobacterium kansasii 662 TaxID=1299326 RepID=X7YRW0_MYCKA|nr:hypothetical protein I545_5868 [Mycobacterium kansasii 662]
MVHNRACSSSFKIGPYTAIDGAGAPEANAAAHPQAYSHQGSRTTICVLI